MLRGAIPGSLEVRVKVMKALLAVRSAGAGTDMPECSCPCRVIAHRWLKRSVDCILQEPTLHTQRIRRRIDSIQGLDIANVVDVYVLLQNHGKSIPVHPQPKDLRRKSQFHDSRSALDVHESQ